MLVEPSWSLSTQSSGWAFGYVAFAALTALCATSAMHFRTAPDSSRTILHQQVSGVTCARRMRWVVLAMLPSSLMLGVTTFLSTDVAAMPLLWTIPLALYLLTFVVAFAARPLVSAQLAGKTMTVLVDQSIRRADRLHTQIKARHHRIGQRSSQGIEYRLCSSV